MNTVSPCINELTNKTCGSCFIFLRRFLFQESRTPRSRRAQAKLSPSKESQPLVEETQEELEPDVTSPSSSLIESEELSYMATTEMYLCCWHQPPPSPWRDQSPVQEDMVAGGHTLNIFVTNNYTHLLQLA